jgi:hypothetical protein
VLDISIWLFRRISSGFKIEPPLLHGALVVELWDNLLLGIFVAQSYLDTRRVSQIFLCLSISGLLLLLSLDLETKTRMKTQKLMPSRMNRQKWQSYSD